MTPKLFLPAFGVSLLALALASCASGTLPGASGASSASVATDWATYGGDPASTNFSPLDQINVGNVANLQRAWTFNYGAGTTEEGDRGLDDRWQVTPLVVDGVMYVSTPAAANKPDLKSTVTALVPETGEVLWRWESPLNIHARGLAYWPGDAQTGPRLIFAMDKGYMGALDIRTRTLAPGFGEDGQVDAYVGVVSERVGESKRDTWALHNPLAIYRDLIISSARPGESPTPGPRSDIRAWNARTGELVWTFHTIPQPGEPNHDTYTGDEWQDRTGANVWSNMSIDVENGLIYAPLSNLNGHAKGPELYANSLVAIDANTGELKWYFQITHHDLWNIDMATPPVLVDVQRDGQTIPAVALAGKHSHFFLFNRLTGEPLIPIEERPIPRSDDPEEEVWPTQPFPTRPGPLIPLGMTRADIPNVTPEQYAYCTKFWDDNDILSQGLYSRPSATRNTINFPSALGGSNWGGPSYNPSSGLFIVNLIGTGQYRPAANAPRPSGPPGSGFAYRVDETTTLPCTPTPWGHLVAVDVNRGEIAWRAPLGDTPGLGEAGIGTGTRNIGGSIQTAGGLVFIGATNDRRFRAFNAQTGDLLWTTELDASAHATPVTFIGRDGKQYVVVVGAGGTAVGTPRMSDTLNAFVLP